MKKRSWPEWWNWELEFTPHLFKRMNDRKFNEINLRLMMEQAQSYRRNIVEGRWVIETRYRKQAWEIIVEPDVTYKVLVVITAYPIWDK